MTAKGPAAPPGRALITGAAGFVGTALREFLRGQGWETVCTDLRTPDGDDWCACDIGDRHQAIRMMDWAGPVTHVFHLAAVTFVPTAGRDAARTFQINLLGSCHVAACLGEASSQARLVYIGSSEVYGPPQSLPLTEEHPLNPANPYAISKAAADRYCAFLHNSEKMDVVIMRPFNHSGAGQSDHFVLSSFAHQVAQIEAGRFEPVLRVGNLAAKRDFLHVNDVVRAYELAALKGESGEAYNVCSGRAVAIGEAVDKLLAMSSADIRIETDSKRMRAVDVPEARGSHDKLTARTGWEPLTSFDGLLRDLLEYWRGEERA